MKPLEHEGQVLGALGVLLLAMWATCGGACDGPPLGAPAGTACHAGEECASGRCVGFDCSAPGTCADLDAAACGPDSPSPGFVPVCTCTGETLQFQRPLCPSEPIEHYGACRKWTGEGGRFTGEVLP